MRLLTCHGCKFSGDCDHARHLRTTLKGYGIRSIKFACAKREDVFAPGQPVIFQTWTSDEADDENRPVEVRYQGYAIEQRGSRVFGFITPNTHDRGGEVYAFEPRGNGYVKIPLSRVRADDSRPMGDVRQCDWCANHPGVGAPCNIDPDYTPRGKCLAKVINEDRALEPSHVE